MRDIEDSSDWRESEKSLAEIEDVSVSELLEV